MQKSNSLSPHNTQNTHSVSSYPTLHTCMHCKELCKLIPQKNTLVLPMSLKMLVNENMSSDANYKHIIFKGMDLLQRPTSFDQSDNMLSSLPPHPLSFLQWIWQWLDLNKCKLHLFPPSIKLHLSVLEVKTITFFAFRVHTDQSTLNSIPFPPFSLHHTRCSDIAKGTFPTSVK